MIREDCPIGEAHRNSQADWERSACMGRYTLMDLREAVTGLIAHSPVTRELVGVALVGDVL